MASMGMIILTDGFGPIMSIGEVGSHTNACIVQSHRAGGNAVELGLGTAPVGG